MKNKEQYNDFDLGRGGLFMDDNSFNLDIDYGRHYLDNDSVHRIKLYRINVIKSKSHSLYGQAKASDKEYFPPIVLTIMPSVGENEQSYYGDNEGGITREDTGKLIFGVYIDELNEKNIEISRGDIVEYNMSGNKNRYYEIEYAQNVDDTTNMTRGGYKAYWKKIIGTPVKEDVTEYFK